ncbi:Tryptophan synthase alpha chain [Caulifigura coniformis]|uniref:Tryptophan synthase alpha chain n=2 Tax=Caulifigura coniformis TaxID=2527983 RepID=A0A517SHT7_9PLAN|nr:Tryptophan synthase alpha chain [Caulifigura coniformis]
MSLETAATPISQAFARAKAEGRTAFMPFVTAGDPDVAATIRLVQSLAAEKVDLIEIGFPYSDPIADGPVIQASYTRALNAGITIDRILDAFRALDKQGMPPMIPMVSYAIVMRRGVERFLKEAVAAGFSGLIIPDLPGDEAGEMFQAVRAHGLDLIQLVAPGTSPERVRKVLASCSGFVYCLGVVGITGERKSVAGALVDQLKWLRKETKLPLAVGFGVSRPEHVATLRTAADGVIVGSAIVRRCEPQEGRTADGAIREVAGYVHEMVEACAK